LSIFFSILGMVMGLTIIFLLFLVIIQWNGKYLFS
jgi:hypothetical protein